MLDTDVVFFHDPYTYLKGAQLRRYSLVCLSDSSVDSAKANGGVWYLQNVLPHGPIAQQLLAAFEVCTHPTTSTHPTQPTHPTHLTHPTPRTPPHAPNATYPTPRTPRHATPRHARHARHALGAHAAAHQQQ